MAKYLYGASVQGIQSFIFQTNKLKEIVGASEIVKNITDQTFFRLAGIDNKYSGLILATAGNIKCIFTEEDRDKLQSIVKNFPKEVMQDAPGITISQAVVKIDDENISDALTQLEVQLKIQRNLPSVPLETGYSILKRARRTGGIVEKNKEDRATLNKLDYQDNISLFKSLSGIKEIDEEKELSSKLSDITAKSLNKWMAVVHADGNGLGNIIQNIGDKLTKQNKFYEFSKTIQKATESALQTAFEEFISKDKFDFSEKNKSYRYPIRPILIGGDDVTFIVRADLALDFTEKFLQEFENETKKKFKEFKEFDFKELKDGLSACAGIAYVKESYPLYYALDLAEELTSEAKKMVKDKDFPQNGSIPHSSISFFKVEDSFVESLSEMQKRNKKAIQSNLDYNYGPYTIQNVGNHPNIEELKEDLETLENQSSEKSKGVSKLRQVVSESFKNKERMQFMLNRMETINPKFYEDLNLNEGTEKLLDLIQLHTFKY